MKNPLSSLFTKILCWFFLNLAVVIGLALLFITFQSPIDLHSLIGRPTTDRLQIAARLITHDLCLSPRDKWSEILSRHSGIHQVDFVLFLENRMLFSSGPGEIPIQIMKRALRQFDRRPHPMGGGGRFRERGRERPPPRPRMVFHSEAPSKYWAGVPVAIPGDRITPGIAGVLLAVSDSVTGNGFFFDPIPWFIAGGAVLLVSILLWIPLIHNITSPLGRMTRAAEEIAKGRFDVYIRENREDEIGRLAMAINHMTKRLDGLVKGQKRFLGDVAHELGSPVARIRFGLGVLEQRVEGDNQVRVADVLEDVDHMSNLVNELLSFSRAQIRPERVKTVESPLLPIVERVVQRENSPEADLIMKIPRDLTVTADPELLARALSNLVRNAVKYAGNAGPIEISAERAGDEIHIRVKDEGSGVPEEMTPHLFEPFFRPEPSRHRDTGGVGLGLAIVKTCVETCRGTVKAENLRPAGFAVTIQVPCNPP